MSAPMEGIEKTSATSQPVVDPPLKVWVMSMNRHVNTDEIVRGLNKIEDESVRRQCLNKSTRDECIRSMIAKLYPPIILHHKQRDLNWQRVRATNGKEYYQSDDPNTAMGYCTADSGSLVALAWAVGPLPRVLHIGIHVMKFAIPRGTTIRDFYKSAEHRLTQREQQDITSGPADEVLFRRLLIVLTIKQAYINAINQPPGFDYRRIQCDMVNETITVDQKPLVGWEIQMFKANLGIMRKEGLQEEIYQCSAMIWRGWTENRIYWNNNPGDLAESLNFLKVEQIIKGFDALGNGKQVIRQMTSERRRKVQAEMRDKAASLDTTGQSSAMNGITATGTGPGSASTTVLTSVPQASRIKA